MLRSIKPKNARAKRALDARLPKEVEDPRTAVFVRGTHTGQVLNDVMRDLMALKRPHVISFSKKNDIHPFDAASTSTASLEFWANKNDASMFVIGQTTKKRPNGLTFVRMFDNRVLDMLEVGVESFVSMADIKTAKSTPGHKPLMHFASDLFDTHPRFAQLKSMLIALFNGEVIESICLAGLEYVISSTSAPTPPASSPLAQKSRASSSPPMGPSLDMRLRRHTPPDPELLKLAMKTPKLKKADIEKGLGKKRKNIETDEMGDLRGPDSRRQAGLGQAADAQDEGAQGRGWCSRRAGGAGGWGEPDEPSQKKRRRQST
ncbi:Brix domain-containing protein [Mycena sanguinolenta]|uniref:Ribosome production factor 2 homolog n=1 Tax=Mycena sanguinolenta TaxID=230812 RepID=A0A8H7DCS2_9AGAR|nr:Brix domain-containing protein [Mycena sanguinolenta]